MRFTSRKYPGGRASLLAAAGLSLVLALGACGGGDSDSPMTDNGDGVEMPDPALDAAQMAAMTAATAADTAADAAKAAADAQTANMAADEASYALARNAAERARAAADAADAANTAAQAATATAAAQAQRDIAQRHQATAETEQANAEKYAGMVMTAKTDADAAAAAANAKATANKVALTKKAAIMAEADANTGQTRPFDGNDAAAAAEPGATDNYRLAVKHTGSAVEVTVADGALAADNDPMYEQAATFGNGQMLVRNIGTDRKIIVVHTDIEAPDHVAFSSEYSLTVDRNMDTTAADTYEVLAGDNDKVAATAFPDKPDQDQVFPEYNADTAAGRRGQFSGKFDGASGTFRCVASGGCTVTTDAMGKIETLSADDWQFTPAAGATVSKPDGDYLTYGFWLDTTTKNGDIASYDTVQTFAMSSLPASTGLSTVMGTAEYEGDAAGVYVHETKKEDGTLDTATSGRFAADVALKAYFEGGSLRQDNTIEGTISNFDLDGGPANLWKVDVSAASIHTDTTGFSGMAKGGGADGSWNGIFHGTGDAADNTVAPPVLVGEFNANFVNGTAAGAFGTRKQQ